MVALRDTTFTTALLAATGTITGTAPSMQDGDVLVAAIGGADDDNEGDADAFDTPAGWTLIVEDEGFLNDRFLGCWLRVVADAGSEPGTYGFVRNAAGGSDNHWLHISSWEGVSNITPLAGTPDWLEADDEADFPDPPSITVDADNSTVVSFATIQQTADPFSPGWTQSTGYTKMPNTGVGLAGAWAVGQYKGSVNSGVEDPDAMTLDSGVAAGDVNHAVFALRSEAVAPGAGFYAGYDWQKAVRARIVYDGGTDLGQEGALALATMLGVTNTGEVLAVLQAAGATAGAIPQAVDELLATEYNLEENAALRLLAETLTV